MSVATANAGGVHCQGATYSKAGKIRMLIFLRSRWGRCAAAHFAASCDGQPWHWPRHSDDTNYSVNETKPAKAGTADAYIQPPPQQGTGIAQQDHAGADRVRLVSAQVDALSPG